MSTVDHWLPSLNDEKTRSFFNFISFIASIGVGLAVTCSVTLACTSSFFGLTNDPQVMAQVRSSAAHFAMASAYYAIALVSSIATQARHALSVSSSRPMNLNGNIFAKISDYIAYTCSFLMIWIPPILVVTATLLVGQGIVAIDPASGYALEAGVMTFLIINLGPHLRTVWALLSSALIFLLAINGLSILLLPAYMVNLGLAFSAMMTRSSERLTLLTEPITLPMVVLFFMLGRNESGIWALGWIFLIYVTMSACITANIRCAYLRQEMRAQLSSNAPIIRPTDRPLTPETSPAHAQELTDLQTMTSNLSSIILNIQQHSENIAVGTPPSTATKNGVHVVRDFPKPMSYHELPPAASVDLHTITTTLASLVLAVQKFSVQHSTTSSSPRPVDPVFLSAHDQHLLSERPELAATLSGVPSDTINHSTATNLVPTPTSLPMALVNLTARDPEQPECNPLLQSAPAFFTHWSSRLTRTIQQTIRTRALRSMSLSFPVAPNLPISFPIPSFVPAQRRRLAQHPQLTDMCAVNLNDVLVSPAWGDIEP